MCKPLPLLCALPLLPSPSSAQLNFVHCPRLLSCYLCVIIAFVLMKFPQHTHTHKQFDRIYGNPLKQLRCIRDQEKKQKKQIYIDVYFRNILLNSLKFSSLFAEINRVCWKFFFILLRAVSLFLSLLCSPSFTLSSASFLPSLDPLVIGCSEKMKKLMKT